MVRRKRRHWLPFLSGAYEAGYLDGLDVAQSQARRREQELRDECKELRTAVDQLVRLTDHREETL